MTPLSIQLRRVIRCLDGRRIPLNREQRASMRGPVPYWGSGGLLDSVDQALFNEELVLLGEDGAPFFEPDRDVAYLISGASWVNNHIHVLRPEGVDASYLRHCLNIADYGRFITGSTRDKLTQQDMLAIEIPWISIAEQKRISRFLDAEIDRIEAVVKTRRVGLELLEEKESATIRSVLTSNEESSTGTIPWLPCYPRSWGAAPLRYVARIKRGASPRPIDDPVYFDPTGSHGWVRISDVTASNKYLESTTQRLSSLGRSKSVAVKPGDLILSIAATVGKPAIPKIDCCIHDGFVVVRSNLLSADFLYYVFKLGDAFRGLGKLGTQLNLNSETIGGIVSPIPSNDEQQQVVSIIERRLEKISRERSLAMQQLKLLSERKQALISAAVTGQIDVTTARGVDV